MAGWDYCEGPLVLQFSDDHHAFHEDAKPGDRAGQLGTRALSSSNQLVTMKMRSSTPDLPRSLSPASPRRTMPSQPVRRLDFLPSYSPHGKRKTL